MSRKVATETATRAHIFFVRSWGSCPLVSCSCSITELVMKWPYLVDVWFAGVVSNAART